jgi:methionyl-tRNA synthetase
VTAERFYITTPIYYVNDAPHVGHAYTTIACDVLARFMRLSGREVRFLTGTDEHGQKVEKAAIAAGVSPRALCDANSEKFRALAKTIGASNDDFIRTTEPRHIRSCQAIWRAIQERGDIYLDTYKGWYAVRDEAFYGEEELTVGPDGKRRAPSGAEVEWVEEPSYFFRLSAWGERLLAFYAANPDFIAPESRKNEVIAFVKAGLRDLSVSRTSFKWGVKVPGDEQHIMYVWLDALTNYITAAGYPDTGSSTFKRFWPADLHMVGKDILRFHTIYWPAFLMAAGVAPPKRVFAHGWWTSEGQKMSKSLGNVIEPNAAIARYGLDPFRYFLLRELPFGQDGDFSHRAMVGRINSDLANGLGNLAQRTLTQIQKNSDAKVPTPGPATPADDELTDAAAALLGDVSATMDDQAFHKALDAIWTVIGMSDRYIDAEAPWKLKKTDPARMATVLYMLADAIRRIALVVQPFMPESAGRLLDQLAVGADRRNFAAWNARLAPGTALPAPQGVFPRFVGDAALGGKS